MGTCVEKASFQNFNLNNKAALNNNKINKLLENPFNQGLDLIDYNIEDNNMNKNNNFIDNKEIKLERIIRFKSLRPIKNTNIKESSNKNTIINNKTNTDIDNEEIKFSKKYNKLFINKHKYSNHIINSPIDNSVKSKNLKFNNVFSKIDEDYSNIKDLVVDKNNKIKKVYNKRKKKIANINKKYKIN